MGKPLFFWRDGEVVETDDGVDPRAMGLLHCLCVDTTFVKDQTLRWGKFNHHNTWVHVPEKEFPPEFLTLVLLLS